MSEVNFERAAYELDEIWNKDWFDKENKLRIEKIASIVDKNITSIADIGCGNGMFLDEILQLKKNKDSCFRAC
jgi:2-polyprenyl-3-methyl-5-hydroxy-6-metoxy-1,4-benzoquinol methylase